jgi:hypothetical protein
MDAQIRELQKRLQQAPVMGNFHPLIPLCLSPEVEVHNNPDSLVEELDSLSPHRERPVLITKINSRYEKRFIKFNASKCPSPKLLNLSLHKHIHVAQKHLLTHKEIPQRIVHDAKKRDYQTVILLLIDGLSYFDVQEWSEHSEPCFVERPTITYFKHQGQIVKDIGFPSIVGRPSIARRLRRLGFSHPYGFSYWKRYNEVSDYLFKDMPLKQIGSIEEALSSIDTMKLSGRYLQIVREGLDGLAHHRREVSTGEIKATVAAIRRDYRHLIQNIAKTGLRGSVYLTSDHGILWKKQHELEKVYVGRGKHSRYMLSAPKNLEHFSEVPTIHQTFYLCHYPYLAAHIPSNDSGVHGGLSSWENIVPFIQVEVNV